MRQNRRVTAASYRWSTRASCALAIACAFALAACGERPETAQAPAQAERLDAPDAELSWQGVLACAATHGGWSCCSC